MSHASGQIKFEDGLVLHYEYDGTSDVCRPNLFDTNEDMQRYWRDYTFYNRKCECGGDEEVEISTTYGNGSVWDGRACRQCKCITKGAYKHSDFNEEDNTMRW